MQENYWVWIAIRPFIGIFDPFGDICFRIRRPHRLFTTASQSLEDQAENSRHLFAHLLPNASQICIAAGEQIPICGFGRANSSKLFKEDAIYEYCAAGTMNYYGLKGHLLVDLNGMIVDNTVCR